MLVIELARELSIVAILWQIVMPKLPAVPVEPFHCTDWTERIPLSPAWSGTRIQPVSLKEAATEILVVLPVVPSLFV